MTSRSNSNPLAAKSETFCGSIIEALHELRAVTEGPVTPHLLSQFLIGSSSYSETLAAVARSGIESDLVESCLKNLKRFQIDLLSIIENAFPQDATTAEELCRRSEKSAVLEDLLKVNGEILDFMTKLSGKVGRRQKELLGLLAQVMKNLVEIGHMISDSFSRARKTYSGSKALSAALDQNTEEIGRFLSACSDIDELKSFIIARLETLKEFSAKKLEMEGKQLLDTAVEIKGLRSQVKFMEKQVSQAQQQAEKMEKVSLLDPMTGIANRRAYQKYMPEEWNAYVHSKEAFSILMIDIDNFKLINDKFGHWAGDKCLEELAKRLKQNLRGTDFLARYGGEEFIAVLPKTDRTGAVAVAEKLRGQIEQTRFLYRGNRIPLTISIGVSTVRESDHGVRSVQDRVDKGLYEAKRRGRNYVSII